jgi:hypothetical protein
MHVRSKPFTSASYGNARDTAQLTVGIGVVLRYAGVIFGALMVNGALAVAPIVIVLLPSPLRFEYLAMVVAATIITAGAGVMVMLGGLFWGTLVIAFGEVLATNIDTALQIAVLPSDSREGVLQTQSSDSFRSPRPPVGGHVGGHYVPAEAAAMP